MPHVEASSPFNRFNLMLRCSNPLWNASVMNEAITYVYLFTRTAACTVSDIAV